MPVKMDIAVTVRGPLFNKQITATVRKAIYQETINKVTERWMRGGKGLGTKRNIRTRESKGELEAQVSSTRIRPRTKGTKWVQKNLGYAKAMIPRVMRKTARRIVEELG